MEKLYKNTRDFLNGKMTLKEFLPILQSTCNLVEENCLGSNSQSYFMSVTSEINELKYCAEEENKLRLEAVLCDIYNNLAHSVEETQEKNMTKDKEEMTRLLFGCKKGMILCLVRECKSVGNKCYGIAQDEKCRPCFVVDIPMVGQISWHLNGKDNIESKKYEFEIDHKSIMMTNRTFLLQEVKAGELNMLSGHVKKVINSYDIAEMNDIFYPSKIGIPGLEKMVNSDPTPEEIRETFPTTSKIKEETDAR